MRIHNVATLIGVVTVLAGATVLSYGAAPASSLPSAARAVSPQPTFSTPAAFDVSRPLRELAKQAGPITSRRQLPPERGPAVVDTGFTGDGAIQQGNAHSALAPSIPNPLLTF